MRDQWENLATPLMNWALDALLLHGCFMWPHIRKPYFRYSNMTCLPLYTTWASPLQFVRPQRTYFTPVSPCPSCPFCPFGPGGPRVPVFPLWPTSPEAIKNCRLNDSLHEREFFSSDCQILIRKRRYLGESDQLQQWTDQIQGNISYIYYRC